MSLLLWEPLRHTKKRMEECLLSTQKSRIKKRHYMTKKSNEIKEVSYLIGDRLDYEENRDYKVCTGALT